MNAGPLSGVRVVDMTTAWSGPYATRVLAFLGAEVIHVESPTRLDIWRGGSTATIGARRYADGDPGERPYNRCTQFNSQNINKLGLSLNAKDPDGRRVLRDLVLASDLLVTNFAPGMLERLGLSRDELAVDHPGLIVVEMPAFGRSGPDSAGRALGPTMEMEAGMTSMIGYGDGVPVSTGPAYLDPLGGYFGAAAAMTALVARQRVGVGQHVELPQVEAAMQTVGEILISSIATGVDVEPLGNRVDDAAPHDAYPAAGDEEWVAISVADDAQWAALAGHIGRPDLITDPRYAHARARHRHQVELYDVIASWTRRRDKHQGAGELIAVGVTAAPVNHGRDLATGDYLRTRGMFTDLDHGEVGRFPYLSLPIRLSRTPGGQRTPAPAFGEHTHDVLAGVLGLSDEEISSLTDRGVTGDIPAG